MCSVLQIEKSFPEFQYQYQRYLVSGLIRLSIGRRSVRRSPLFVQFCSKFEYLCWQVEVFPLMLNHSAERFDPWDKDRDKGYFVNFIEKTLYLQNQVLSVSENSFSEFLIQIAKKEEVTKCQVWAVRRMRQPLDKSCGKIFSGFLRIVRTCIVQQRFLPLPDDNRNESRRSNQWINWEKWICLEAATPRQDSDISGR
jgi:hypothetical protein